jgi:hypothetical protein
LPGGGALGSRGIDPAEELKSRIAELRLAADPAAWANAGFAIDDHGLTRIGTVPVRFGDAMGWTLVGPRTADLDGLVTEIAGPGQVGPEPREHPNGVSSIDHIVVFTSSLARTIAAFEAAGIRCRRVREVGEEPQVLRQAFFRLGEVVAEVVEVPEDQAGPAGSSRFWGLTVVATDLEGLVAELGPLCGSIRDAVQPGRRIATVNREAGLGLPVALISPAS